MNVNIIDNTTTKHDIMNFITYYKNSLSDLCVYENTYLVDIEDYISDNFINDIHYLIYDLEYNIYYTHNNNIITSIALVNVGNDCYIELRLLCGNITTKNIKINNKSQGYNMLDFIFNKYKNKIIIIEPGNEQLINYYVNYKKPSFPVDMAETNNYLIYGNLLMLPEYCFLILFKSINSLYKISKLLLFDSLSIMYKNTNNLLTLKQKLLKTLIHLISNKQLQKEKMDEYIKIINSIKYYDISDIIEQSQEYNYITYGGMKLLNKKLKTFKNKTKKYGKLR